MDQLLKQSGSGCGRAVGWRTGDGRLNAWVLDPYCVGS